MSDRRTELSDYLIADDLVERSAERRDVGDESFEAPVEEVLDLLRIGALGETREADEIGHQDCYKSPLIRTPYQWLPALGAEARCFGSTGSAGRAGHATTLPGPMGTA